MKLSIELKAAVIAIVIILGAIWGFNFLKGKNLFVSNDEYYAVFQRIDGIVESGSVYIKGYNVGNITKVEYNHRTSGKFVVRFVINDNVQIPKGTEVKVKTSNLIASAKDLELIFSDSTVFLKPGDTLRTGTNPGLSELLDPITNKIDNVLLQLDSTLYAINDIFNPKTRYHLQNSLISLDTTISSLKQMLMEGGNLHETMANLKKTTDVLSAKSISMAKSIDNVEAITDTLKNAGLAATIGSFNQTLNQINTLVADINQGQGTANKIVHDSTLYTNLTSAVNNLDSLLVDLKENPKRYVHFSVFGGKE